MVHREGIPLVGGDTVTLKPGNSRNNHVISFADSNFVLV